jgi:hypothetical protein
MTGACHQVQLLLVEMGVLGDFFLGWSQTMILQIYTFQVAIIIGLSFYAKHKQHSYG